MRKSNLVLSIVSSIALLIMVNTSNVYGQSNLAFQIQRAIVDVEINDLETSLSQMTSADDFVEAVDYVFKTFSSITMHVGYNERKFWEEAPPMMLRVSQKFQFTRGQRVQLNLSLAESLSRSNYNLPTYRSRYSQLYWGTPQFNKATVVDQPTSRSGGNNLDFDKLPPPPQNKEIAGIFELLFAEPTEKQIEAQRVRDEQAEKSRQIKLEEWNEYFRKEFSEVFKEPVLYGSFTAPFRYLKDPWKYQREAASYEIEMIMNTALATNESQEATESKIWKVMNNCDQFIRLRGARTGALVRLIYNEHFTKLTPGANTSSEVQENLKEEDRVAERDASEISKGYDGKIKIDSVIKAAEKK